MEMTGQAKSAGWMPRRSRVRDAVVGLRMRSVPGHGLCVEGAVKDGSHLGRSGSRDRPYELLLFKRLRQTDDARLRAGLVERYLGLAARVAHRYANGRRGTEEDVLQVARMGLVKAVDRFDPERGLAFSTFAVPTILGEIKRYFRSVVWATHVPRGLQETSLAVERAARKLSMREGRSATVAAIAAELKLPEEEVIDALHAAQAAVSLDTPVTSEDGDGAESLIDTLGHHEPGYELAEDRVTIEQSARVLSDRDRLILKLRFQDDLTQGQIAEHVGVSQMQVSRLIRRSLRRLREASDPSTPATPAP